MMPEGVSWEFIAMVIGCAALASASVTEVVKKFIQQAIIERRPDKAKPAWRGTILRLTSVVSGAVFGWFLLPDSERFGLILGIGAGSLTTESVGLIKRIMEKRSGSPAPKDRTGNRTEAKSEFSETPPESTEFRPVLTEDDIERADSD